MIIAQALLFIHCLIAYPVFLHVLSHSLFMSPLCDIWGRAGNVFSIF